MGALQSRRSRDPKNKPRTSLHRPYVANASVASNQRHSQVTETDSLSKQEGRRERERECVRMERRSSVRRDMERPLTNFGRHSGSGDVTTKQVVCLSSLLFNMRRPFCIWGVRRRPGKQQNKTNNEPQQQTVCREHCDEIDEVATT